MLQIPKTAARALRPRTSPLARLARAAVERRLRRLGRGRLLVEEDGGRRTAFGRDEHGAEPVRLRVHDEGFWVDLLLGGSLGAAESFVAGAWSCDDLPALIELLVRDRRVLTAFESGPARLAAPLRRAAHALRRNTRSGARRNIAAHYDLGNAFFASFLDPSLTYSCALFERPGATLAQASEAKLERLCRLLELRPQDHLLEIGCGWGSLALHAATHHGCRVTATTISAAQHALATERVRAAGLADRVTILAQDYRDLRGRYDKLVSVEMIEAVGADHLDVFVESCARLLSDEGLFALQAITIRDQLHASARDGVDFIKRDMFPGSFIPSVAAILDATRRRSDFALLELRDFGPHYATTLAAWRANLHAARERVAALGADEAFLRLWDYYFAYCEGGFRAGQLGVAQMLFARPGRRRAPA